MHIFAAGVCLIVIGLEDALALFTVVGPENKDPTIVVQLLSTCDDSFPFYITKGLFLLSQLVSATIR